MPPIQESCQFDPLDSAGDSEAQKEPVEVRLYRAQGDIEVLRDFLVAAALQQQLGDLLFPRRKPDGFSGH